MRYLIMALVLALSAPAWGEDPCKRLYEIKSEIEELGMQADIGHPSGADISHSIQAKIDVLKEEYRFMLEGCDNRSVSVQIFGVEPTHYTVEVPDMNGDRTIDEQDKRLAEYAMEEFRRNFGNPHGYELWEDAGKHGFIPSINGWGVQYNAMDGLTPKTD